MQSWWPSKAFSEKVQPLILKNYNCKLRQVTPLLDLCKMAHPQPRQLDKYQNKTESESSLSSSHTPQTLFHSNQTSTTTTTSTTNSHFSFNSKLEPLSHQHLDENITTPCCFNVCSRRWSGLKLRCSAISFMASHGDVSVHVPSQIRKKKLTGKQKREELEREVSMLQNMLNHEEKVHEILERVHQQKDGSSLCIPNFLPPKMKELLAELTMVEEEIARLEGQISQLQIGLNHEQEITKDSKSKQWQQGSLSNPQGHSLIVPPNRNPTNRGIYERISFETKALHFISKAIKGDYNLNDFSINEKMGNSRVVFADQKENHFHEEVGFQEKVSRKSGVQLKPPSPLRDPRHQTPKKERDQHISSDLPPKYVSNSILSEENSEKSQPNKLSESIMKCLIFIYVRLLRTSRAMEIEKSGPISRSTHSSLNSRSFRAETSLNSKPSLMLQKDSRQQDPYGIFNTEENVPRDIGPYKNLVIFTSSSLDPKCLSSSSSIPLLRNLRVLMSNLQKVDLRFLTHQQKLAFWINMYNACIMHGFLQYGVPSSPEKLLTLMNKATLNIGGNIINAQAVEHFILRKPPSSTMKESYRKGEKDDKEAIVRELYGLDSLDPNITFALCCGTRSSPAVRIYTAEGVVAELEKSKLEYLQASIMVSSTKRIGFPELLLRNKHDFAEDTDSLVKWVCHQLPASGSLRKSMVDCFRGHNNGKVTSIVEKIPYDFEFQYLLAI